MFVVGIRAEGGFDQRHSCVVSRCYKGHNTRCVNVMMVRLRDK
jgi:hypothetical protein